MFDSLKKRISWLLLQYELITCLNMFEPWERVCLNSVVCLILSLVLYSSYVYLPHYIVSLVSKVWYILSSGEERIDLRYESG